MREVEQRAGRLLDTSPKGARAGDLLGSMTTQDMIQKAAEVVKLGAQAMADRGQKVYTVEIHCAVAGKAMCEVAKVHGQPLTGAETAALFHALYNHSAWRQKLEKEKVFTPLAKRATTFESLMQELDEEGV